MPRSRSYWLSRYLSYGDWHCGHDEVRHGRSLDDVKTWFAQPYTGTVETAAAPFWRLLSPYNLTTVVVRRPIDEVVGSLLRTGLPFDPAGTRRIIQRLDHKLDQIEARVPNVLSVQFADLTKEAICAAVFERCLPYRHDPAWWAAMGPLNLQTSLPVLMRYYQAHKLPLEKLALTARQTMLVGMVRPITDMDGLTIQEEPFETFFRDGQALFSEHLMQVGEPPDAFLGKNLPLMRTLEQIDCLQIVTARCNGRMFGYLMAVLSPSLESPDIKMATHTTFYASKSFPGLGMKLQRASIEGLRAKGVNEVSFRAGTRGSGPRMASVYKRLGAVETGQTFMLSL